MFPEFEDENAFASPNIPVFTAIAFEFEVERLFKNMEFLFFWGKKNFCNFAPVITCKVRRHISSEYMLSFIFYFLKNFSNGAIYIEPICELY
jgi:hypothetical protein